MFCNAYQNGAYLQIWDSKVFTVQIDKNDFYRQLFRVYPSQLKKQFDKQVKSFLYTFSSQSSRINFPSDDLKQLSLHQRYLVLQIYLPQGYQWSMGLTLTDITGAKWRISITTNQGKQQLKYFSLRYPIDFLQRNKWLFLGIDLYSFMLAFKNEVYRSLDHIDIGCNCRLRRIFTLKQWLQCEVPKGFWLTPQLQQKFQLIQYEMFNKQPFENSKISQTIKKNYHYKNQRLPEIISPKKNEELKAKYNNSAVMKQKCKFFKPLIKNELILEKSRIKLNYLEQKQFDLIESSDSQLYIAKNNPKTNKKNWSKSKIKKLPKEIAVKPFEQDKIMQLTPSQSDKNNQQQILTSSTPDYCSGAHRYEGQIIDEKKQEYIIEDERQFNLQQQPNMTIKSKIINRIASKGFPTTVITKNNSQTITINNFSSHKSGELELIFDQMVGCYYHPQTNTYYQIKS